VIVYKNGNAQRGRQGAHPADNGTPAKHSWRDRLPVHPAADLFPLVTEDEKRAIAEDVKKNGLREPATLWWDQQAKCLCLLDGRTRLDALELLGRDIFVGGELRYGGADDIFRKVDIDIDPIAFVISKNIHRRHLTSEQKDKLVADLLKAIPEKSNREIARMTGRHHETVAKVREQKERTGEIRQLKTTKGKDGKSRPTRRKTEPEPAQTGASKAPAAETVAAKSAVENIITVKEVGGPIELNTESPPPVPLPAAKAPAIADFRTAISMLMKLVHQPSAFVGTVPRDNLNAVVGFLRQIVSEKPRTPAAGEPVS
jgi:transposase